MQHIRLFAPRSGFVLLLIKSLKCMEKHFPS